MTIEAYGVPSSFAQTEALCWFSDGHGNIKREPHNISELTYYPEDLALRVKADNQVFRFSVVNYKVYASNSAPGKLRLKFWLQTGGQRYGTFSLCAIGILLNAAEYLHFEMHSSMSNPSPKPIQDAEAKLHKQLHKDWGVSVQSESCLNCPNKVAPPPPPKPFWPKADGYNVRELKGHPTAGNYVIEREGQRIPFEYRMRCYALEDARKLGKGGKITQVLYISETQLDGHKANQSRMWPEKPPVYHPSNRQPPWRRGY